jgi:hypothetical protein
MARPQQTRGRLGRAGHSVRLGSRDPRVRRNAQAGLTDEDVDNETLEVVNGKIRLKATGDASEPVTAADGMTLEAVDGAFRVKAADHLREFVIDTTSVTETLLTTQQLSDELALTNRNVADVNNLLSKLLVALTQGSRGNLPTGTP